MNIELTEILLICATADGQLDFQEQHLLKYIIFSIKTGKINDQGLLKKAGENLRKKIQMRISPETILKDNTNRLSKENKGLAYALALEICCANSEIDGREESILKLLEQLSELSDSDINCIKTSAKIRYGLNHDYLP